jgi:hypothetical protein
MSPSEGTLEQPESATASNASAAAPRPFDDLNALNDLGSASGTMEPQHACRRYPPATVSCFIGRHASTRAPPQHASPGFAWRSIAVCERKHVGVFVDFESSFVATT